MREEYETIFSEIFLENLIRERRRLGLTQEKMAGLLLISLRSYADLEHGVSSCGTLTLVLFLLYCCEDQVHFLHEAEIAFSGAYAAL